MNGINYKGRQIHVEIAEQRDENPDAGGYNERRKSYDGERKSSGRKPYAESGEPTNRSVLKRKAATPNPKPVGTLRSVLPKYMLHRMMIFGTVSMTEIGASSSVMTKKNLIVENPNAAPKNILKSCTVKKNPGANKWLSSFGDTVFRYRFTVNSIPSVKGN